MLIFHQSVGSCVQALLRMGISTATNTAGDCKQPRSVTCLIELRQKPIPMRVDVFVKCSAFPIFLQNFFGDALFLVGVRWGGVPSKEQRQGVWGRVARVSGAVIVKPPPPRRSKGGGRAQK